MEKIYRLLKLLSFKSRPLLSQALTVPENLDAIFLLFKQLVIREQVATLSLELHDNEYAILSYGNKESKIAYMYLPLLKKLQLLFLSSLSTPLRIKNAKLNPSLVYATPKDWADEPTYIVAQWGTMEDYYVKISSEIKWDFNTGTKVRKRLFKIEFFRDFRVFLIGNAIIKVYEVGNEPSFSPPYGTVLDQILQMHFPHLKDREQLCEASGLKFSWSGYC